MRLNSMSDRLRLHLFVARPDLKVDIAQHNRTYVTEQLLRTRILLTSTTRPLVHEHEEVLIFL